MDKSQLLYSLFEVVIFFLPVAGLIWKAAKQSGRIEELEKDLNGLGKKVEGISQTNKQAINEISRNITSLTISISNINTSLEYIKKSIDEVKK
ncbi:MAG: hypothetical protein IJ727_10090 [Treponema sp.]|nr:hypothetical protein [Treponema sp.]